MMSSEEDAELQDKRAEKSDNAAEHVERERERERERDGALWRIGKRKAETKAQLNLKYEAQGRL